MGVTTDGTASTRSRRPTLPATGRRRQANGHGPLPDVDGPQRVRPRRDADRDVRLHDRCLALSPQPRTGPLVPEVPRTDRAATFPGHIGAHGRDVLPVLT